MVLAAVSDTRHATGIRSKMVKGADRTTAIYASPGIMGRPIQRNGLGGGNRRDHRRVDLVGKLDSCLLATIIPCCARCLNLGKLLARTRSDRDRDPSRICYGQFFSRSGCGDHNHVRQTVQRIRTHKSLGPPDRKATRVITRRCVRIHGVVLCRMASL